MFGDFCQKNIFLPLLPKSFGAKNWFLAITQKCSVKSKIWPYKQIPCEISFLIMHTFILYLISFQVTWQKLFSQNARVAPSLKAHSLISNRGCSKNFKIWIFFICYTALLGLQTHFPIKIVQKSFQGEIRAIFS